MQCLFAEKTGHVLAIAQQYFSYLQFPGKICCDEIMLEIPYVKIIS